MEYVSMYKKYYTLDDKFNEYYNRLFNSESSIQFSFSIQDNKAFIHINNELLRLVEDIYVLNNDIISMTFSNNVLPKIAVEWIINHTLIEEIKQSNELEGIASTRQQIKKMLGNPAPKGYKRLYGMVYKYKELLNNDDFTINDNSDIKSLYDKILLKDIEKEDKKNIPDGKYYRKHGVDVVSGGKPIHEGIKTESGINEAMDSAIQILNDNSIALLIRVAIFHYLIGYIHPYYDGNGRLSRFISTGYLSRNLSIISALQVSMSCFAHKNEYYEIFKTTNDVRNKGDLTYFTISFLTIMKEGLANLIEVISDKLNQYQYYLKNINEYFEKGKQRSIIYVLLQCTLFASEGITIKELSQVSGTSKDTVRKYINELDKENYVIINKDSQPYKYDLNVDTLDLLINTKKE